MPAAQHRRLRPRRWLLQPLASMAALGLVAALLVLALLWLAAWR